ncbi:MAG: alpha/beta hydrolase [Nitrospirae bacterium]|nr:alpha/beta hydrolase [Nitrospirota bacterium]
MRDGDSVKRWVTLVSGVLLASCASMGSLQGPFFRKTDYPRWQMIGAEESDLDLAVQGRESLDDLGRDEWVQFWMERGRGLEREARVREASGDSQSAARTYFRAAGHHIIAMYPHKRISSPKGKAHEESVRIFLRGAALLDAKFERVVLQEKGEEVVGYLFLPRGPGPSACVIVSGGLDGWKEEAVLWTLPMAHDFMPPVSRRST